MNRTLTSWKEIAQYLGKGIRTVQRWEQNMGLPVRRPRERERGIVLATTDALDGWLNTTFAAGGENELQRLRDQIANLRNENEVLRAQLKVQNATTTRLVVPGISLGYGDSTDGQVFKRCSEAIERSIQIRLHSAEVLDMARNLKVLRKRGGKPEAGIRT